MCMRPIRANDAVMPSIAGSARSKLQRQSTEVGKVGLSHRDANSLDLVYITE